jgi:transposase
METLCNVEAKSEFMIISFEENNIVPEGYSSDEYESKGFVESKLIQDFPLRGKAVFVKLKKRRWRHKRTKSIIKRDYSFIAEGSKFTQELSDFLKDSSGYATRYHQQHSELLRGQ